MKVLQYVINCIVLQMNQTNLSIIAVTKELNLAETQSDWVKGRVYLQPSQPSSV
jgi:hypothetical protein